MDVIAEEPEMAGVGFELDRPLSPRLGRAGSYDYENEGAQEEDEGWAERRWSASPPQSEQSHTSYNTFPTRPFSGVEPISPVHSMSSKRSFALPPTTFNPLSFPLPPIHHPVASSSRPLSYRSSNGSLSSSEHTQQAGSPIQPRQIRSMVSMDALPHLQAHPPTVNLNSPVTTPSSSSHRYSAESSRSQSPMTSSSTSTPRRAPVHFAPIPGAAEVPWTYHNDENIEADISTYADAHRVPVDATLRSIPGVVGLGEGWAGGPQRKLSRRKRWFTKRGKEKDEDPLALWTIGEGGEGSGKSPASPIKEFWNRSKRAFGASMPALVDTSGSISRSAVKPTLGNRAKAFFSRSKLDLTEQAGESRPSMPRSATLEGLLSFASTSNTPGRGASTPSLPSYNTRPSFPRPQARTPMSRESNGRSQPNLLHHSTAPIDPLVRSGPPPPLRPGATSNIRAPPILLPEAEEQGASISSTSIETPTAPDEPELTRIQMPEQTLSMKRSTTFGAPDITTELHNELRQNNPSVVGLDTLAAWAEDPGPPAYTIPIAPAVSSPKRPLISRLRSSLSPSRSKSISRPNVPSPLKPTVRPLMKTSKSAPLAQSPSPRAIEESLVTPPVSASLNNGDSRRRSWVQPLGGDWSKRLSRLTEMDEDEKDRSRASSPSPYAPHRRSSSHTGSFGQFLLEKVMPARSSSLSPYDGSTQTPGQVNEINLNSTKSSTLSLSLSPLNPLTLLHPETNLHLPLPLHVEDHHSIDIDDILDSGRRKSIIDSLDLRPFPDPPSRNGHKRGSSDSGRVGTPNPTLAWGHSRNRSAPVPGISRNSSGEGSAIGGNAPTSSVNVVLSTLGRVGERENGGSLVSMKSGVESLTSPRSSFGGTGGLSVLGRRDSPASLITDGGLEEVTVEQAVRQSVPLMTKQASFVSVDEWRAGGYSPAYSPGLIDRESILA